MGTVTLGVRVLLAAVFGLAAVTKLRDRSESLRTFRDFGVGENLARAGATLLAPAELAVAVSLLVVPSARWGAVAAVLLLVMFIVGIANALRQGRRPDCGCFGGLRPTPIGRSTVVRNLVLLGAGVFAAIAGPGPAIDGWIAARNVGELVLVALVVIGTVVGVVVVSRSSARSQPNPSNAQSVAALLLPAVGEAAPAFDLGGACGESRTLGSLCAFGRPVVLVFGSSGCGACTSLFPHLGRWQETLAESLQIAVIGIGDADLTRSICQDYGVADVLVDSDGEVWSSYGRMGTPSAVTVTPDGAIANGPALGQEAIEDLIRLTLHRDEPMSDPWKPKTHVA